MPVEEIQLRGSPQTDVGGVTVFGNVAEDFTAGQQVPEQAVDSGYTWRTRVGPNPRSVSLTVWSNEATKDGLVALTNTQEPIAVTCASLSMPSAAVNNISGTVSGESPGAFELTVDVVEVQQGGLSTSGFGAAAPSGTQDGSGGGLQTGGSSSPFQPA